MGYCWYCHWGWSKPVMEIYDTAFDKLYMQGSDESALRFGPSHTVLVDEKWSDSCIDFCLIRIDDYNEKYTSEQLNIIKWSLEELKKIPIDIRDPRPDNYDDNCEDPENYPPKNGIEMVRR